MIAAAIRAIRDWRIARAEARMQHHAGLALHAYARKDFAAAEEHTAIARECRARIYRLEDAGRGVVAS
mgnify:CR=1 FL=1